MPAAHPPRSHPPTRAAPPQEVRIIGGVWKRTRLAVPLRPGLRPTPGRVRETLFNWLGQDLSGWRCVDAFAGSGALGFEAASRGAATVWLIEQDTALVQALRDTATRLQARAVTVERGDALVALKRRADFAADVVFLDPPFLEGNNDELTRSALAAAQACLATQGWVYLEAPRAWTETELAPLGLTPHKQGKAGAVHFALLRRAG